jgi:hypothetical protein
MATGQHAVFPPGQGGAELRRDDLVRFEGWEPRVARMLRIDREAQRAPPGTAPEVHLRGVWQDKMALAPSRDVVATERGFTEARRSMLALDFLNALGFATPFDTRTYASRAAWLAPIQRGRLAELWASKLWLEDGWFFGIDAHVARMNTHDLIKAANAFLVEHWGVSCALLFGPQQRLFPGKRHRSQAARSLGHCGVIRWWRGLVPAQTRVARGY